MVSISKVPASPKPEINKEDKAEFKLIKKAFVLWMKSPRHETNCKKVAKDKIDSASGFLANPSNSCRLHTSSPEYKQKKIYILFFIVMSILTVLVVR